MFFRTIVALVAALWMTDAQPGIVSVPAGGDLQQALDRAAPGTVIELAPGATYTGNFTLPRTPEGGGPIVLRTASNAQLPAPGERIDPADAPRLAKIQSPTTLPAVRTAPGAHDWRLELLEFGPNRKGAGDIITLGDGSSEQSSLAQVPSGLAIDRCYIHGDPATGQKRAIGLNSADTVITGSFIADIKAIGQDTQAIAGWNGPGPFRIENNHLEAAGEVFLLGGATPGIHDLVPSDVVFSRNYVTRPPSWRDEKWQIKNLLEIKNARRVMIEHNLFEYNWQAAQAGYAIVLTPRSQGGQAPWATVEDVTFRMNVVRHVAAGINILGHDNTGTSGLARRIRIQQNLFYDVSRRNWGGDGFFLLIGSGPSQITVDHNTILQTGNLIAAYGVERGSPIPIEPFVFRDNIALHNKYGVHGQGRGVGNDSLDAFFPGAVFTGNVIAGARASAYPKGNQYPSVEELMRQFVDPQQEDYRLKPNSPYLSGPAADEALGAPVALLNAGVQTLMEHERRARPRVVRKQPPPPGSR